MEYYAKSPTYILPESRMEKMSNKINEILIGFGGEFTEDEIKILKDYGDSINSNQETEHKTLSEHLDETVKCADAFFDIYGDYLTEKEKKLVLMACREHDIGKVNYIFQTKVNSQLKKINEEEIPHGFLSALAIDWKRFHQDNPECTKDDFRVLLTAVYYHHNRKDICSEEEIEQYCKEYFLENLREYKNDKEADTDITNRSKLLFRSGNNKGYIESPREDVWCEYMLVKGLLNKFDWSVSAGYDVAEIESDRSERLLCKNIQSEISGELRLAQKFMIDNRDKNVVIIAPTGSGKTEAALLWLNGEKGFYTLPLKVSSNAIYKRIKIKYKFKNSALLHSDSMSSYIKESEGELEVGYRNFEQAKLLAYPLTVCTVDQLFKFVYKTLGTEIFAATLKYSKVIIDEIQSYSPNIIAALLYGLSEIKRMGGKFAIITATFPPILNFFMKKCKLIENTDYVYQDFSGLADKVRHKIKIADGYFDIDDIVTNARDKKVLVICNTVYKAQQLYKEINGVCEYLGLLHSRFIRKHRDVLENDIMDFSNDEGATGIWITTQIVEASLDIDFDILYTEMCTADSLLQRMGRCNRAGKKSVSEPNIIIFDNGTNSSNGKIDGIYDKDIYNRSIDFLRKYEEQLFSETNKILFINEVYDITQIKNTAYYKQIENNIKKFPDIDPLEYDIQDANEDFRNMDSITVIPEKIYNKNQLLIEKISEILSMPRLHKGVRKMFKDKLESITININLSNKKKYPQGVDYATVKVRTDSKCSDLEYNDKHVVKTFAYDTNIHRANLEYDFDEETGRGMGLLLNVPEDEVLFI